jgi:hypothetical protein
MAPGAAKGARAHRIVGEASAVPTAAHTMQIAGDSRNGESICAQVLSSKPQKP